MSSYFIEINEERKKERERELAFALYNHYSSFLFVFFCCCFFQSCSFSGMKPSLDSIRSFAQMQWHALTHTHKLIPTNLRGRTYTDGSPRQAANLCDPDVCVRTAYPPLHYITWARPWDDQHTHSHTHAFIASLPLLALAGLRELCCRAMRPELTYL